MIKNREDIRTVNVEIMPMYIASTVDPASDRGAAIRNNDPEKRHTLMLSEGEDSAERMFAPSRFGALVDQYGNVLNTVTPKTYRLIPNAEIVAALDLASDAVGLDLTARHDGNYYKGRSRWTFTAGKEFKVPGDDSPHFPMVDVWHDSRGTGGLTVRSGIWRQWCTNGCTTQVLATGNAKTNHRQEINLMGFFCDAIGGLADGIEEMIEVHQTAGQVKADLRHDNNIRRAIVQIYRSTAPRYRERLSETIRSYSSDVGPTVHALIQSVSDLATHNMQDGVARHNWNHNSSQALVEALMQEVNA